MSDHGWIGVALALGGVAYVFAIMLVQRVAKLERDVEYLRADVRLLEGMLLRGHEIAELTRTADPHAGSYIDIARRVERLEAQTPERGER